MAKLHELLAVKNNLNGQATKASTDLKATFKDKRHLFASKFKDKRHLFASKLVTFNPFDETEGVKTEEQSDIQTSVSSELKWLSNIVSKAIDNNFSIDSFNTLANADLEVDGNVLLKNVPATALLSLEDYINNFKEVVATIPTLDPAKGFTEDSDKGKGIYKARETETTRTKKVKKVLVMSPATEQHPAQTAVYDADEAVGKIRTQEWSSMITPARKSELLDKCDTLLRAIKVARAKANDFDGNTSKVGNTILNFILQ